MQSGIRRWFCAMAIVAVAASLCAPAAPAQGAPEYPVRPPAPPEQLAHGQQLFGGNCSVCHGSDARGGEK